MARPDGDSFTIVSRGTPDVAWMRSSFNFPSHSCFTIDKTVLVQKINDSSALAFCLVLPFAPFPTATDAGQKGAVSIG